MRSLLLMSLVLVSACAPATAVLLDGDALDDTASIDTNDPGADTDTSDVDTDTSDVDTDTEADTTPQVYTWSGERGFTFEEFNGSCTDTLVETGMDITNDPEWAEYRAGCSSCNLVFLVTMDQDHLCARGGFDGYGIQSPALRGIGESNGQLILYFGRMDDPSDWSILAEPEGGWSGFEYEYDGRTRFGNEYQVEGSGSLL